MRRRDFIKGIAGAAAAWPLSARAQQERMRRIGVLMQLADSDPESRIQVGAFLQSLSELGWAVGRNLRLDTRWGEGDADRIRTLAAELVPLAPDVVLAPGGTVVGALQQASRPCQSCS
jgi:putative tryptophan/tyrosine transport system substrate-binding protein